VGGSKGKAVYLSAQQIQKTNPLCAGTYSSLAPETEPCAIFIGVQCLEDCKYSLKLSYGRDGPQSIVVGVPQHDIVKEGSFNYYYLNVRENKT
jgi:hypothetical protein